MPGFGKQRLVRISLTAPDDDLASTLKDLIITNGEELEVMTPRYQTMAARVQKLRQKHPFALKGYCLTSALVEQICGIE